jgi:hypothetical protein
MDLLKIKEALARENLPIIEALKKELNYQKHIGKGTLYNGFYYNIRNRTDSISLLILNDTPYMWTVNDGKSSGVNASYQAIADWTFHKEVNGELTFGSEHERNNFISHVKHELEDGYYTPGGKKVAPRRYFFIDFARESWRKSGAIKRIEDAIVKDVEDIVNKELVKKEIKLTIG